MDTEKSLQRLRARISSLKYVTKVADEDAAFAALKNGQSGVFEWASGGVIAICAKSSTGITGSFYIID